MKPRPMNGLNGFLARLNGWALSLALHGGIALVAGLSVFGVHVSGGSGSGSGGLLRAGLSTPSFAATLRSGEDQVVSGASLGDPPQYGRLTSEQTPLEPIAEELPEPSIPFDVFAVGASDPLPAVPLPLSDRAFPPSNPAEGRASKLPPGSGQEGQAGENPGSDGSEGASGAPGPDGSGGQEGAGLSSGKGSGDGDGNATEIYTPAPAYPSEARRRNIEGTVLVELVICADGSCTVHRIVESSGFIPLDDAVQSAVTRWKYRSADIDGRSASTTKRVRFVFKLGH